jgi:predicted NAD/FAD-binding protein
MGQQMLKIGLAYAASAVEEQILARFKTNPILQERLKRSRPARESRAHFLVKRRDDVVGRWRRQSALGRYIVERHQNPLLFNAWLSDVPGAVTLRQSSFVP